jgi:hypothetical protein
LCTKLTSPTKRSSRANASSRITRTRCA